MRTHRPGDAAFRRGSTAGEGFGEGSSSYQPYRPEPEDELILPEADADSIVDAHVDNTPPGFDDQPPPIVVGVPPVARGPAAAAAPASPPAPQWRGPDEPYDPAEAYEDRYRPPGDEWDRPRSGVSPLAIGGFVLLGVLAIAVGAFISGIFSGGVAVASPTPTPLASVAPSATLQPTVVPTPSASPPVASIAASGSPGAFADGFTARTQPCATEPASQDGCNSSGATVTGGSVWVWVGFRKGSDADVLGVTLVNSAGTSVGDGSLPLGTISCGNSCNGWARFRFGGLSPGDYTIRVDRNGAPAAEATFTVTS